MSIFNLIVTVHLQKQENLYYNVFGGFVLCLYAFFCFQTMFFIQKLHSHFVCNYTVLKTSMFSYYKRAGVLTQNLKGFLRRVLFLVMHALPILQDHVTLVLYWCSDNTLPKSAAITNSLFSGTPSDIELKQTQNCLKVNLPSFYSIQHLLQGIF